MLLPGPCPGPHCLSIPHACLGRVQRSIDSTSASLDAVTYAWRYPAGTVMWEVSLLIAGLATEVFGVTYPGDPDVLPCFFELSLSTPLL